MSLVLVANKESLLVDPINWVSLIDKLAAWSQEWISGKLVIPDRTDALFRERTPLVHPSRALSNHGLRLSLESPTMYSFFDAYAPTFTRKAKSSGVPMSFAKLIDKINLHDKWLSILGILPNQLRTLLKEAQHPEYDAICSDISVSLFLSGYRIWEKRQELAYRYWQDSAPENHETHIKRAKKIGLGIKETQSKCSNALHYMQRFLNLSNQRPRRCPCYSVKAIEERSRTDRDIREFFVLPSSHERIQASYFSRICPSVPQKENFMTKSDKIRSQHDRGKKRKPASIFSLNIRKHKHATR
jgi:hypothetical protein